MTGAGASRISRAETVRADGAWGGARSYSTAERGDVADPPGAQKAPRVSTTLDGKGEVEEGDGGNGGSSSWVSQMSSCSSPASSGHGEHECECVDDPETCARAMVNQPTNHGGHECECVDNPADGSLARAGGCAEGARDGHASETLRPTPFAAQSAPVEEPTNPPTNPSTNHSGRAASASSNASERPNYSAMMLSGDEFVGASGAQFVGRRSTLPKCGSLETLQLHGAVGGRTSSIEQALYLHSGTLHPTLYTLHLTPYTLHPTPCG